MRNIFSIMLETLLIIACLGGTSRSCETSGDAWQRYYGYDKIIEQYGKKNPVISQTVGAIGLFKQKRIYFQIQGNWYYESSLETGWKNVAWWKKEF